MKAAGFVTYGTDLVNPDLAAVANAMGIKGIRVEKSKELRDALRDAFSHRGPALVDVITERDELTIPPAVPAEQVKGFTLFDPNRAVRPGTSCSTSRVRTSGSSSRCRSMHQSAQVTPRVPGA